MARMRKDSNLAILCPAVLLLAGIYLIHESITRTQWYMDVYLVVGATILAMGMMAELWAIQRRLSVRRMEQHVRRRKQVQPG